MSNSHGKVRKDLTTILRAVFPPDRGSISLTVVAVTPTR